jgi:hypothetical protein
MRNVMCCGFVAAVLAMSAGIGAQDDKMNKMGGMKSERSYTGCIERSEDGAFRLAHTVSSDAAMKKSMAKETMSLSSTSVDLAEHVGHKVTVKGVKADNMGGAATFAVKSIKMVAPSC